LNHQSTCHRYFAVSGFKDYVSAAFAAEST